MILSPAPCEIFADKNDAGRAVGNAAAHRAGQWRHHHPVGQHFRDCQRCTLRRPVVQPRMFAVLRGHLGEMFRRGAVSLHVAFGAAGIDVDKHRPPVTERGVIGRSRQRLERAGAIVMRQLLGTQHQHAVILSIGDGAPAEMHGIGAARTGILDGAHRDARNSGRRQQRLRQDRFLIGDRTAERVADERRRDIRARHPRSRYRFHDRIVGDVGERARGMASERADRAARYHHAIWMPPGHAGTLTSAMPFAVGVPSLLMAVSVQRVTGPASLTSARRIRVSSG